jgi:nucleoside-diphosphate-sugar epimerase
MFDPLHLIFGTGPAGRAIMNAALQRGHRVRLVNRSGRAQAPAGVPIMAGDVRDVEFVRQAAKGADYAYQALNAPYHQWVSLFPALQQGILDGLRGSDIPLISLENLYMYGDTQGMPMQADTPTAAQTRKGAVRARMAEQLQGAHARGDLRSLQARAADFVGPEVIQSGLGERVLMPLLRGQSISVMGDPSQLHSFTYMPDVGRCMVQLALAPAAYGQVWHLPCPEPISVADLLARMASSLSLPLKMRLTPDWLLTVLGWVNPTIGELPELLYQWNQPFVVDHQPIEQQFGLHATPWERIIPATLSWYQTRLSTPIPQAS